MLRHYPWKLCAGIAAAIALLAMPVILLRQSALPVIDWQTADDAPDQTHACAPQKQELSNGLTGHVIPLDIYLPPPESDTDIVLILLHGFQSRKEDQQDNALALCTAGYRVIVPTIYHHPLTPNVEERVADVSYILDVLAEQNS
ncbi:MAG TPA: hypothetical protein PKL83_04965, partial [bacterium]|nr:hypothetical protein [bacterium]